MLKPLEQWICDKCGQIIEQPKDGYVQFTYDGKCRKSFVIVHHKLASPHKDTADGCYIHDFDSALPEFLGSNGLVKLTTLIDAGSYHDPHHNYTADTREWLDLFHRLHVPYYEEARQYWSRASTDGYFGDANEVLIHTPSYMQRMIEHYKKEV